MNYIRYSVFALALLSIIGLYSCGEDGGDDPKPSSVTMTLTAATLNGTDITPLPDYSATFNFTAEGEPDGYTTTGNAAFAPTLGTSGTFAISGQQVTFTSGGASRAITIQSGSISKDGTTVTLQWELTKLDDGVTAQEQGTYVYTLEVSN